MALALFDLDNTLLDGDSDYLWGRFLCRIGEVDAATYEAENEAHYRAYTEGTLDIHAFLRFSLAPLARRDVATLCGWRRRFVDDEIRPRVTPGAVDLIEHHRARGDTCLIVTATNRFVTAPIAALLGIGILLATEPAMHEGRFTGEAAGIPCFREGKVERLRAWCSAYGRSMTDSWFYSDSLNDLPLLETVTHPVTVRPDARLRALAQERAWPVLDLHGGDSAGAAE